MKLESISTAGNNYTQSGVGKKFLIISISLTILLNFSVAIWFFLYIQQNGLDKFFIKWKAFFFKQLFLWVFFMVVDCFGYFGIK